MLEPSAYMASTAQDLTLMPSRSTVHAPQLLVSQPTTVPVLPNCSRSRWASRVRGSTSTVRRTSSTVTVIETMGRLDAFGETDGWTSDHPRGARIHDGR